MDTFIIERHSSLRVQAANEAEAIEIAEAAAESAWRTHLEVYGVEVPEPADERRRVQEETSRKLLCAIAARNGDGR